MNDNLASTPIDIIELKCGYFADAQPKTDQHGQDGEGTSAISLIICLDPLYGKKVGMFFQNDRLVHSSTAHTTTVCPFPGVVG